MDPSTVPYGMHRRKGQENDEFVARKNRCEGSLQVKQILKPTTWLSELLLIIFQTVLVVGTISPMAVQERIDLQGTEFGSNAETLNSGKIIGIA
jgi:hypothetical protein